MDWLTRFDSEFAPRLCDRAATFRAVFEELLKRKRMLRIFETGSLRTPGNWGGDGQSTLLFEQFVRSIPGSDVWSIDINEDAVKTAKEAAPSAVVMRGDSVALLNEYMGHPINLLYLDSADDPVNTLMELCAAMPHLTDGSVVLVDDIPGKGPLVCEYMRRAGVHELASGYQKAWVL